MLTENMYFHGVKSTAHPPIKGALGHSTDCIVEQPNTAAYNVCLHSCKRIVSCWKRNSGLKQKLHLQTMKHTGIRKFKLTPACLLLLLLSVNLCVEESMCLSKMTKRVASSIGTVQSKCCQYTVFLPFQTLRQLQPGRVAACHHLHQCSDPVR